MTARQQWVAVAAVIAVLGVVLWGAMHYLGDELFPVAVGSEAPPFVARTLEITPETRTIADYRGQVVLLNIWATWCGPCRAEMPSIQALHERYRDKGLKVVAVSIDQPGAEAAIREFANEYQLDFEILHDPTGEIQQRYQTTGVPETFVIGRDGLIRKKHIGATNWNSGANQALIAQLLGEPVSATTGGSAARAVAALVPPAR